MEKNIPNWLKQKKYPHFTPKLTLYYENNNIKSLTTKGVEIIRYVKNNQKIGIHSFYPLLHYTITTRRYKKIETSEGSYRAHKYRNDKGIFETTTKQRQIFYPNHRDSQIYAYYAYMLGEVYENTLTTLLKKSIIAYRKIPVLNSASGNPELKKNGEVKNKCNINFAKDVFNFINNDTGKSFLEQNNECIVMTFDVSNFFDTLDHDRLKKEWINLLNEGFNQDIFKKIPLKVRKELVNFYNTPKGDFSIERLPKNHYNVFKSLTRFSYVNQSDILREFKIPNVREFKRKYNDSDKYPTCTFKKTRFNRDVDINETSILNFHKIREHKLIKKNATLVPKNGWEWNSYGIPQGTPLSAFLSNLYMLEFDKKLVDFFKTDLNGLYRRYSDDIIVVCSIEKQHTLKKLIEVELQKIKLKINQDKTQVFLLKKYDDDISIYEIEKKCNLIKRNFVSYLGFDFNGKNAYIRCSSLSNYYRKLKKSITYRYYKSKRAKKKSLNGKGLFKKKIFRKYSYQGKNNFINYANKSAQIMDDDKISKQVNRHWFKINDYIKQYKDLDSQNEDVQGLIELK